MSLIKSIHEIRLPEKAQVVARPANSSRVIILDRSGSMHYEIGNVVDNVVKAVEQFPSGDTITIGWFSSEGGMFRFELIGHALTDDRSVAIRILNNMRSVKNLTCFSEILADAKTVVDTLKAFNLPISLIFHSDGYPVVSNYGCEERSLFDAIAAIRPYLADVTVVGYGEYYNRSLLSRMADAFGGRLVHSQNYMAWASILVDYVDGVTPIPRIPVESNEPIGIYFDLDSNVYEPDANRTIYVSPDLKALYHYGGISQVDTDTDPAPVYIAARILLTKDNISEAVALLTELGDVAAAEKVSSAWTPQEFGKVAEYLEQLASYPDLRFEKGCHPGQAPALDAPCLLDVINALVEDDAARLWIGRGFDYKRIGKPRKPVEGTPEFVQADDLSLPLDALVWNEKRLNLSALFTIPGIVLIGKNDLNLPEEYPCIRFKTFTIVNDGRLNITSASFSMSRKTFELLQAYGVIEGIMNKDNVITKINHKWFPDVPYKVNLSAVPLVNGLIAMNVPSTFQLCTQLVELLNMESDLRVLNVQSKALKEAGVVVKEDGLTPEQQAFLAERGIVNGVFRPKMEEGEASDSYIAPTLEIAIKGYSSLPHPDKVAEKEASGKSLTPAEQLIKLSVDDINKIKPRFDTVENMLQWIEDYKCDLRREMTRVRSKIQRAKFAVLLGHRWFDGVDRQTPAEHSELGYTFVFKMGEEKIEI